MTSQTIRNYTGSKYPVYIRFLFGLFLFTLLLPPVIAAENGPLELIHSISSAYEDVQDYTAIFVKQERMRGILHREERTLFKFKKPFNIYMQWLEGPGEGRKILYSQGKNDGRMIVNPHGLIGLIIPILYIAPDHPMVKNRSRHTIKEAGIGMTIEYLIEQCDLAKQNRDLRIEFIGEETISDRSFSRLEVFFPEGKSYYAGHIVVYVDKEYNLPTRTSIYDWKDELVEKAVYDELKINVGLGEIDFDPANPEYGFKVK